MDQTYLKPIVYGFLSYFLLACTSTVPPSPVYPVPEPKQVEWQKMETYAFVHFGMNTFTDSEWGYGDADVNLFNPSDLNCEQWVQTFVKAGMKGVIFTAKHHDGFCLWPSEFTDYSVKSSPWKNGKGDVVRELSDACKKYGIKFAVYLSPWDRNRADYGTPSYVEYFYNQLNELMTQYGEVFEIWVDGANGGDGWYGGAKEVRQIDRKNYYDLPRLYKMASKLQPQAMLFSDGGPDCRWVGNESGYAGETNWSFLRKGVVYPGYPGYKELTSGHADGDLWTPAECDVSIRPGWFYHQSEDRLVKTVDQLKELYYQSVGRNATLLLNFPVDKTGKVNPIDSANAVQWHLELQNDLANNLFAGMEPDASDTRGREFSTKNLTDGSYDTYWATSDGIHSASLTFHFPGKTKMNRLVLQEYIPLGQRVKNFLVEVLIGGIWVPVDFGEETTTIGYKRILRFDMVETDQLRIHFKESRGPLCVSAVEAFYVE